eukprot:CAMPEP_0172724404 /NCGR_PEP_ID=MMETSP1074-20121228/85910_1 /TAXON_ID=2916 /ORGANISM="Ceratium fusus, Strain PA161109" /LENGTH=305 /DNA_ID=CAMNT_0013550875 /DNA_START=85 /DNA_END=1002 /DNA_ORIENTATION=-
MVYQACGRSSSSSISVVFASVSEQSHSVCVQKRLGHGNNKRGTARKLWGFFAASAAVMAQLPSAWLLPASSESTHPVVRTMQLSSRQAKACTGAGGQLGREPLPFSPFKLPRSWRQFGCRGRVALGAKKKKKQVDPAILEKRAKAAAIREEAIKKAAEARRLKEQGESAEVAPKEPSISAKPAAAPPQTIATPEPARPAPIKKPIQTDTARKRAPSVAEKRAIKALEDQKKPEGRAMAERPKPKSPKVANVIKEATNSVGNVPTEDEVMKMKVVELKDVLRGNKLRLSGRKAELLERVLNFIRAA